MKLSTKSMIILITFAFFILALVACNSDWSTEPNDKLFLSNALGGESIWSFETEEEITSTPTLDGNNRVYIRTTNSIIALDAKNGTTIWKTESPSNTPLNTAPLVSGNIVFGPEKESRMAAFDSDTGDLLWRTSPIDSGLTQPSALEIQSIVVGNNMIYVARFNSGLTAYRAIDGQMIWEQEYSSRSNPHLAIDQKALYLGMGPSIKAFDNATGDPLWEKTLDAYIGPMLIIDDFLYTLDERHSNLFAIDVDTQELLWTKSFPETENYEFDCLSEVDDSLLIAGRELTAVNKTDGQVLWSTDELGRLECPAIAKNKIFIRNSNDTLYVIDLNTGKEIGRVRVVRNTTFKTST